MRRELTHFMIEDSCGGDQNWFTDAWMKIGGCGAVTACDLCVYGAKRLGLTGLVPFDAAAFTKDDYLAFGMQMKHYLGPRPRGIHKTETWIHGFSAYLKDLGLEPFRMRSLSGNEDVENAVQAVRDQIDRGLPVPYLMLLHRDKKLDDYMWHWFLLAGYEEAGTHFLVKAISYGKEVWMDLRHLWRTGRVRKGGMVLLEKNDITPLGGNET